MKPLTAQDWSQVKEMEVKEVSIPSIDAVVCLRRMTAAEYMVIKTLAKKTDFADDEQARAYCLEFLWRCIVDPATGQRVFDADTIKVLIDNISDRTINKIFNECLDFHGMSLASKEGLEKNSEPTASGDGGSGSPGSSDGPTQIASGQS